MIDRIIILVLGLLLFGVGIWCIGLVADIIRHGERLEGKLTGMAFRAHTKGATVFNLSASFWYNGEWITCDCVNVKSYVFAVERRMARFLASRADKDITVWYDPARPTRTVCSVGLSSLLFLYAFLVVIGALLLTLGAVPGLL